MLQTGLIQHIMFLAVAIACGLYGIAETKEKFRLISEHIASLKGSEKEKIRDLSEDERFWFVMCLFYFVDELRVPMLLTVSAGGFVCEFMITKMALWLLLAIGTFAFSLKTGIDSLIGYSKWHLTVRPLR